MGSCVASISASSPTPWMGDYVSRSKLGPEKALRSSYTGLHPALVVDHWVPCLQFLNWTAPRYSATKYRAFHTPVTRCQLVQNVSPLTICKFSLQEHADSSALSHWPLRRVGAYSPWMMDNLPGPARIGYEREAAGNAMTCNGVTAVGYGSPLHKDRHPHFALMLRFILVSSV